MWRGFRRVRLSSTGPGDAERLKFWLILVVMLQQQPDEQLFATGLKMGNVLIPETGLIGGTETLLCDFQLEADKLLSLKWFKDGHEFFRYLPQDNPPVLTFNVSGFAVHVANASLNQVTIKSITLNASGIYRCEILAEKSFQALYKEGNFTVIVPPDPERPRISNISSSVLMGDAINGNCTSSRSLPPAQLTFHINDEKIERPHVIEYRPIITDTAVAGVGNLQTSVLGLRIKVSYKYFRRGVISIKCIARIGQRTWETGMMVQHLNNFPSHLSKYGRVKSSAGMTTYAHRGLVAVFGGVFMTLRL